MPEKVKALVHRLAEPIVRLASERELVFFLTRQRIALRYRESVLGMGWAIASPAIMLCVYTFVFGVVFQPRWTSEISGTTDYALLLYLGLCAYWFVSDCAAEAPNLVVERVSYVKKVVFPLDILTWVSVATALFHTAIRLLIYCVAAAVINGSLEGSIILLPLAWVPLLFLALGISWFLSAIGVFLRDVGEIVSIVLTAVLFLSPVFYPIESVPAALRWLLNANPLTLPIGQIRGVAAFGNPFDWTQWLGLVAATYAFAWFGYVFFRRTQRGFADAI